MSTAAACPHACRCSRVALLVAVDKAEHLHVGVGGVQVVNWVERHKAAICPIRGRQDQLDNIPSAMRSSCACENEPKHAALLSAQ